MSTPTDDAPTDVIPPARHAARPGLPRWIRRLAVPIVLAWLALTAILNVVVPQLETVGQERAVSLSPNDAPARHRSELPPMRSTTPSPTLRSD